MPVHMQTGPSPAPVVPQRAGLRGLRRAVGLVLATVLGVTCGVVAVPGQAQAATNVTLGACSLPRNVGMEALVGARTGSATLVLGMEDIAWAREIERRAGPTKSSREGLLTRQQLRLADQYVAAPLPSAPALTTSTALSREARASTQRMLTLRYAMEVAADGRTPALGSGVVDVPSSVYAGRIRDEVMAWARLPHWGSTLPVTTGGDSLLATGEVASTVALGYSLVSGFLTRQQRSAVRSALISKALVPVCPSYAHGMWMVDSTYNWGVVVNTGMAMAALVVADQDEPLAAAVLAQALRRAARAARTSGADGGSPEGPNYAELMHRYLAYLSSSVSLTLGAKGEALLPKVPGAARYISAVTGPSGETFDYSDANGAYIRPYLALWNARHGGDPLGDWLGQQVLDQGKPDPLVVMWTRGVTDTPAGTEPLAQTFATSGAAVLRSSWAPGATWVGVKGGTNTAGHSHLDLGSFVLEVGGRRFVDDVGQDSYAVPGYGTLPGRFSFWRVSTAGHSTLARPGVNQPATAGASISAPATLAGGTRQVSVDLTKALSAVSASRRVQLAGTTTTIQDVVRFRSPTTVRWSAQTRAAVSLQRGGRSALLTVDGRTVEARLSSSTPGAFRVVAAPAPAKNGLSNAGWRTLRLDVPTHPAKGGTSTVAVVVSFIPR